MRGLSHFDDGLYATQGLFVAGQCRNDVVKISRAQLCEQRLLRVGRWMLLVSDSGHGSSIAI